ncbi:MAG: MBL fold metallo-hydrolase [Nocardioidaceae bacterium]|nr:MBL fold metallo-hydrolase [Nocardioidaceae bacterium]NUS51331.1 MBL fold metallo-hydrolase [Nocardioidaceae bacterium]
MRITKFGHACVRLEYDGQVVVVDPGAFTEMEAVDGATAVLVTHEHIDHLDLDRLRATDAPIFTIEAVRTQIADGDPAVAERVTVVSPGQQLDVGLPVTVVGELHAVIHEELPRFYNSGYVVDVGGTRVYHPGDSFTPSGGPVDLLLLPVHAPWSKISEVVEFGRTVGAPRSLAVHDGLLNDVGLMVAGRTLDSLLPGYQRLEPGSDVDLA